MVKSILFIYSNFKKTVTNYSLLGSIKPQGFLAIRRAGHWLILIAAADKDGINRPLNLGLLSLGFLPLDFLGFFHCGFEASSRAKNS
jgi:hypothetical protein